MLSDLLILWILFSHQSNNHTSQNLLLFTSSVPSADTCVHKSAHSRNSIYWRTDCHPYYIYIIPFKNFFICRPGHGRLEHKKLCSDYVSTLTRIFMYHLWYNCVSVLKLHFCHLCQLNTENWTQKTEHKKLFVSESEHVHLNSTVL